MYVSLTIYQPARPSFGETHHMFQPKVIIEFIFFFRKETRLPLFADQFHDSVPTFLRGLKFKQACWSTAGGDEFDEFIVRFSHEATIEV